jgi:hypothetical protein
MEILNALHIEPYPSPRFASIRTGEGTSTSVDEGGRGGITLPSAGADQGKMSFAVSGAKQTEEKMKTVIDTRHERGNVSGKEFG